MTESTLSSVIEVAFGASRLNTNEVSILGLGGRRGAADLKFLADLGDPQNDEKP